MHYLHAYLWMHLRVHLHASIHCLYLQPSAYTSILDVKQKLNGPFAVGRLF